MYVSSQHTLEEGAYKPQNALQLQNKIFLMKN